MLRKETGEPPEDLFRLLPQTKAELDKLDSSLPSQYKPDLDYLRDRRKYIGEKGQTLVIDGKPYELKAKQSGKVWLFSLYHESPDSQKRKSIDWGTDGGCGRLETVEVLEDGYDSYGNHVSSSRTKIDLRGGICLEQELQPIPIYGLNLRGENKQIFILDTKRFPLAQLVWLIGDKEYKIEFTSDREMVTLADGSLETYMATGERFLGVEKEKIPFPPGDELLSGAVRSLVRFEPFVLKTRFDPS